MNKNLKIQISDQEDNEKDHQQINILNQPSKNDNFNENEESINDENEESMTDDDLQYENQQNSHVDEFNFLPNSQLNNDFAKKGTIQNLKEKEINQNLYLNKVQAKIKQRIESQQNIKSVFEEEDLKIKAIIDQVMRKKKKQYQQNQISSLIQEEEVNKKSKVAEINQSLIQQNVSLMNQINKLTVKLKSLTSKMKPKNQSKNNSQNSFQENSSQINNLDLAKQCNKYQLKISKAEDLKTKLESRLICEKNKSLIASNTFRSLINKIDTIGVNHSCKNQQTISLVETSKRQNSKNYESKINQLCVNCQKYKKQCRKIPKNSSHQNQSYFSPVLQLKNFLISKVRPEINQFQLSQGNQNHKKINKDAIAQVSLDETEYILKIDQMNKQEETLQKIIESNNKKIKIYEQKLMKIVDEI